MRDRRRARSSPDYRAEGTEALARRYCFRLVELRGRRDGEGSGPGGDAGRSRGAWPPSSAGCVARAGHPGRPRADSRARRCLRGGGGGRRPCRALDGLDRRLPRVDAPRAGRRRAHGSGHRFPFERADFHRAVPERPGMLPVAVQRRWPRRSASRHDRVAATLFPSRRPSATTGLQRLTCPSGIGGPAAPG